jgi:hypothetical protein|tara:strand:+ start:752 stop:1534 length:783 start_codon:yes stop_codon:yes gene_type:complete
MITIPRKLKINNFQEVEYEVYPVKDFQLTYKHWKKCKEGDWGVSDDGYVAQCLAVKTYSSGVEMTYPYGKQWVTKTSKLEFLPHWETKSFNSVSTKSQMQLELQKRRSKDLLEAYMTYIMAGKTPDFEKLGQMYRPDQKKPAWTVKRLLKTKGMKQMIKDKMKEVLTERGIDEGYVLDTIKDAIGVAKVNEDPGNMIKAAKELSDYLDMKPKAKTQTDTLELDLSHQIEANFEKQTKKLTATKTQELPSEAEDNDIGEKG